MKANELMIGDWVNETYEAIDGNMYEQEKQVGIYDFNDAKNFEPIEITPEILEKNGFIRYGMSDVYGFECLGLNNTININNHDCTVRGKHTTINKQNMLYVHTLQHALRLCKIDKEIEL